MMKCNTEVRYSLWNEILYPLNSEYLLSLEFPNCSIAHSDQKLTPVSRLLHTCTLFLAPWLDNVWWIVRALPQYTTSSTYIFFFPTSHEKFGTNYSFLMKVALENSKCIVTSHPFSIEQWYRNYAQQITNKAEFAVDLVKPCVEHFGSSVPNWPRHP